MNKTIVRRQQRGATLLVALVMLLALTILAVSNMRGVTLEARITANRVEASRLQNLADAALREGEFRFYGPAYLREKLEPKIQNCSLENKLNKQGNNRPCLLEEMTDDELEEFFHSPITFLETNSYKANYTEYLKWMPYRGLDAESEFKTNNVLGHAFWNSYRVISGSSENEAVNPEYGAALEGRGTFFFLINGQGKDSVAQPPIAVAAQSTIAVVYTGLNN